MKIEYKETGEVRCPEYGEYFRNLRGIPIQARFDFHASEFPILEQIITEDDE